MDPNRTSTSLFSAGQCGHRFRFCFKGKDAAFVSLFVSHEWQPDPGPGVDGISNPDGISSTVHRGFSNSRRIEDHISCTSKQSTLVLSWRGSANHPRAHLHRRAGHPSKPGDHQREPATPPPLTPAPLRRVLLSPEFDANFRHLMDRRWILFHDRLKVRR